MSRFNLIDEEWIPVRFLDGTCQELGIQDILLRSREIEAIEDPSPLVVAALHRFLLAVLYRALQGPTDIVQARALFREGLPDDKIVDYLERWRDRFWLFDEEYPFGQNPNVPQNRIEPWTKLTAEHNASSNKVLFDHTNTKNPGQRTAPECARWLISTMSFSISGGRGYYPSPSPNAMICIALGKTLHQTISYNLVHYPNKEVMFGDAALWEREPKKLPLRKPKQIASGYADLYTWQSRMVLLEDRPSGLVSFVRFVAGQGFENPSGTPDPMQPYIVKKKGKFPVPFNPNRETWQDFDSLLPESDGLAPLTIQNAISLARNRAENLPKSVLILGLKYTPPSANVDFWRMERFVLPEALAGDRSIRTEIRQLLDDAENSQKQLRKACRSFAQDILSRGDRKPAPKDVRDCLEQLPATPWYWSTLESCFHEILRDYSHSRNPDEIRCKWLKDVRDTLRSAWDQHRAAVSTGDAWAIRALVKAEGPVLKKLKELTKEIAKYEPQEEGA